MIIQRATDSAHSSRQWVALVVLLDVVVVVVVGDEPLQLLAPS